MVNSALAMKRNRIYCIDALKGLKKLKPNSVDMLITSPPYFQLRDYKVNGQMGLEDSVDAYLDKLLTLFDEAKRVVKDEGTCWVNLGDRYGDKMKLGKPKSMLGIPEQFMLGMIQRGWILRNKIIWHKPNPIPSSTRDRFTNSWEYLFLFAKSPTYFFDLDAIRKPHKTKPPKSFSSKIQSNSGSKRIKNFIEQSGVIPVTTANLYSKNGSNKWGHVLGKNPGDCWTIPTQSFREAHFATFPERLVEDPIKTTPESICSQCGKSKLRITHTEHTTKYENRSLLHNDGSKTDDRLAQPSHRCLALHYTIGWKTCSCGSSFKKALVLDPFMGAGTTAVVAQRLGRDYIGFELNPDYIKIAEKRIRDSIKRS